MMFPLRPTVDKKMEETAIKATDYDKINVMSSENHQEEKLITNIAKREELTRNYEVTKLEVDEMDKLLSELDADDRLIIDRMFVHRERKAAESLAFELCYEVRRIYQKKDEALRNLARRRFGQVKE
jgi:hypothetical protein